MAKDLPYFKFNVSEYINGNITLEDFYTQGVFINVCAFYWFKSGKVTITELKRRLSKAKAKTFATLIDGNLIKVDNENVSISFLDEQLHERGKISFKNSENGKHGGRPKKSETKPTALILESEQQSETIAKKSNIEEKREEEKREREDYYHTRQKAFEDISNNYLETEPHRNILTNRGWRSANKTDTDALLFHFLESQADFDTPKANIKNHFKKWLNKRPLDELQTLAKTINERLSTKVS